MVSFMVKKEIIIGNDVDQKRLHNIENADSLACETFSGP